MEDIIGIKCQLFFVVSQPLTVYEVDFLILDMIWMASKQAITLCLDFLFDPSKSGVLNPNSD
jgi:hypothetical protein